MAQKSEVGGELTGKTIGGILFLKSAVFSGTADTDAVTVEHATCTFLQEYCMRFLLVMDLE